MDLLRAAKSALEIDKEFDQETSETFLNKAKEEFAQIEDLDKKLLSEINIYQSQIEKIKSDPLERIRWGEKILTIASRLSLN
ncbi:MAG: hypothetical protein KatS3mg101_0379 [Patescibacteria group bacterium]|nr:MAG: hypothetical protein KatS3mg101_0379 [Patescibacteria group bacterium]